METAEQKKHRTLVRMKKSEIIEALTMFNGNRARAAAYLKIAPRTITYRIKVWGLSEQFPSKGGRPRNP